MDGYSRDDVVPALEKWVGRTDNIYTIGFGPNWGRDWRPGKSLLMYDAISEKKLLYCP